MDIASRLSLIMGLLLTLINISNWSIKTLKSGYNVKRNNENLHDKVEKHDNEIKNLRDELTNVSDKINTLFEITKIQTRQVIVSLCLEAIEKTCIDQYQLQAIEDLYLMYKDVLHGNSYVSTLVMKIRKLKVEVED